MAGRISSAMPVNAGESSGAIATASTRSLAAHSPNDAPDCEGDDDDEDDDKDGCPTDAAPANDHTCASNLSLFS
jgi:hypothetical protein